MKISAKTDYACRAILEMALRWPDTAPVQLAAIVQEQKVPMKFLTQIMLSLKQLGYIESVRGKNGGYRLLKAPNKIKLSRLVIDLENIGIREEAGLDESSHILDIIWCKVGKKLYDALDAIDFESIANQHKSRENVVMFHI